MICGHDGQVRKRCPATSQALQSGQDTKADQVAEVAESGGGDIGTGQPFMQFVHRAHLVGHMVRERIQNYRGPGVRPGHVQHRLQLHDGRLAGRGPLHHQVDVKHHLGLQADQHLDLDLRAVPRPVPRQLVGLDFEPQVQSGRFPQLLQGLSDVVGSRPEQVGIPAGPGLLGEAGICGSCVGQVRGSELAFWERPAVILPMATAGILEPIP
jgi:hypothetical protein